MVRKLLFYFIILLPSFLLADLEFRPGIRACAMGYAYTSVAKDAYASYWNPAMLRKLKFQEIAVSFGSSFKPEETQNKFSNISLVIPIKRLGIFSLMGSTAGSDVYSEDMIGIQFACRLLPRKKLSIGVSALRISREITAMVENPSQEADCISISSGMFWEPFKRFNIGLSAKNINRPKLELESENKEKLPIKTTLGLAYKWEKLLLSSDVELQDINDINKSNLNLYGGIEYNLLKDLKIQSGYNDKFVSLGFSFDISKQTKCDTIKDSYIGWQFKIFKTTYLTINSSVRYSHDFESSSGYYYLGFRLYTTITHFEIKKDADPPYITDLYPMPKQRNVPLNTHVNFLITDHRSGVNLDSTKIFVKDEEYHPGDENLYYRSYGDNNNLVLIDITPKQDFRPGDTVKVKVHSEDLYKEPNKMTPFEYSFRTGKGRVEIVDTVLVQRILKDTLFIEVPSVEKVNQALQHLYKSLEFYYSNDLDEAEKECRIAIEIAPELEYGHLRLGSILYIQGKEEEAIEYWKKAYEINPENKEIEDIIKSLSGL